MQAEMMMIGTELLLGQVQDTNATFMGQTLAEHGINLYQKTTIGDNPARIKDALDAALRRSEVVLCSGGLGPTEDDITRECVAELLGRPLEYRPELYTAIEQRFALTGRTLTENNRKQAMAPKGAEIIENPNGTAPGILVEDTRALPGRTHPAYVICMPGVPHELHAMLLDWVVPWLRNRFGLSGVLHYRVLKVCGMGESRVDSAIGDLIQAQQNPTIGLLAGPDAVRIRLAAYAESIPAADALIDPLEDTIRKRLPGRIMGYEEDTLESVVDRLLSERGWSLSVVETASGGALAQRMIGIAASSFAGAQVLPIQQDALTVEERAVDLAGDCMLQYKTNCTLVLLEKVVQNATFALWMSPKGTHQWEISHYGQGARRQLRIAMAALEGVRQAILETTEV